MRMKWRKREADFMDEKPLDVLCVGLMLVDLLVRPADAGIFSRDTTWADDMRLMTGGDALNEAIVLAKLGLRTGLVGRMGGDAFGRIALDTATSCGIDISGVRVLPDERTVVSIVLINEHGDRHFLSSSGNIHHFCFEDIDLDVVGKARIVNIGSLVSLKAFDGEGAVRLLQEAHARGAITSADVSGTHRKIGQLAEELKNLDYFMPSYDEAMEIAGMKDADACADAFLKYVREAVVIKLGAKGCLVRSHRERFLLPGFQVRAIDTTGAGDSFVAGFLAGLSRGLSLRACGLLANATGAIATTQLGATGAATGIDGVADFLIRAGTEIDGVQELAGVLSKWQK